MLEGRFVVRMSLHQFLIRVATFVVFAVSFRLHAQDHLAHHPKVRVHFIAAEEVEWDYAPSGRDEAMGHPFHGFENVYVESGPHRIGRVYRKCIYREYTDAKFNHLMERNPEGQ